VHRCVVFDELCVTWSIFELDMEITADFILVERTCFERMGN
jgi:hypothetical protein